MNITLSPARLRRIIADCHTEADIQVTLRLHRIRFSWITDDGQIAIRVPCRTGALLIKRDRYPAAEHIPPVPYGSPVTVH